MQNTINVLDKGFVRLVRHMGDDAAVVDCARRSYGKGTKTINEDRGLIRTLLRDRHTSPLECVHFTFYVKLPIFVSNQWVRHRTWSFNQLSGRYSEMPDEFYVPKEEHVTKQDPINKQGGINEVIQLPCSSEVKDGINTWSDCFEFEQAGATTNYKMFLKAGMRRELARINLPLSQYTEMYATCDLHNLLHFLKLRLDKHAQYEIRVYAEAILELIRPIVPIIIEAFEDYILNGMTLSRQEIEILKEFLQDAPIRSDTLSSLVEENIVSKRERLQFYDKLARLLYLPK